MSLLDLTNQRKINDRRTFTLGGWVALSVSLGAIKESLQRHTSYRAVFFHSVEDRDAFLELCLEQFPAQTFFRGTIERVPAIQHKPF